MTPLEMLDAALRDVPGMGPAKFTTFMIPYRRYRGDRIRVLAGKPSLYGRVLGSRGFDAASATLIVSVPCADIIQWFTKHLTVLEGAAIEAAEAGEQEKADAMLAQYVAVRDRLSTAGARSNL